MRVDGGSREIPLMAVLGTVLIAANFLLFGCTSSPLTDSLMESREHVVVEETRRTASGLPSWGDGIRAFQAGDYGRAMDVFERVSQGAENDGLRSQALYALACTKLATARDAKGFQDAMAVWERWTKSLSSEVRQEDPRMLAPLLTRLSQQGFLESRPSASSKQAEDAACRRNLRAREEQLRLREEELQVKTDEIQRLNEQMEALETIHRSMDEKRKGAISP